uniref:Uncharacterized protein n=1 Tax=Anguilla anguilla TaxID=7936 RepID=A0A0E9V099_ANGAN
MNMLISEDLNKLIMQMLWLNDASCFHGYWLQEPQLSSFNGVVTVPINLMNVVSF